MGVSPNIEGRLEILFSDEIVYVVRSNDGEMARIDMDADTVTTADNLESLMPSKIELQYSALSEDGGTLFVGANAVDSETLEVDEDQERSWYLAFGQEGSCTLGLTVDNQIASYDADGDLLWSFEPGFARTQQTLYSVWIPEWSSIAIQDMGTATVQLWRVEEACPGE